MGTLRGFVKEPRAGRGQREVHEALARAVLDDHLPAERRARDRREPEVEVALAELPHVGVELKEDERHLDLRLSTITSPSFSGQMVVEHGARERLVYLSLTATRARLLDEAA